MSAQRSGSTSRKEQGRPAKVMFTTMRVLAASGVELKHVGGALLLKAAPAAAPRGSSAAAAASSAHSSARGAVRGGMTPTGRGRAMRGAGAWLLAFRESGSEPIIGAWDFGQVHSAVSRTACAARRVRAHRGRCLRLCVARVAWRLPVLLCDFISKRTHSCALLRVRVGKHPRGVHCSCSSHALAVVRLHQRCTHHDSGIADVARRQRRRYFLANHEAPVPRAPRHANSFYRARGSTSYCSSTHPGAQSCFLPQLPR